MHEWSPRTSTESSSLGNRSLWQKLVEPVETITAASERRQASLVSAMLFVLALSMISGVVYMGFFSRNPNTAFVLAGADIVLGATYFLSRSRYYRLAAPICVIVLAIIPILNVGLAILLP